jgi:hypothetical protein
MHFGGNGATSGRQGQGLLHRDNPPSDTSLLAQQLLAEKSIHIVAEPPYPADLAPGDISLFPTLKTDFKGTRFATIENIKCDGRTPEDSKRSLPPLRPTMAGSMEQVCLCACVKGSCFEGD